MGEGAIYVDINILTAEGSMSAARAELKRERSQFLADENEIEFPNKKLAKEEASTEDTKSEVSNPCIIFSPQKKIRSSPTEDFLPPTSTYSLETETLSEDGETNTSQPSVDHSNDRWDSESTTSHVVLEIPKHASTTGIRKITFKFSKRKEDYDPVSSTPVDNGVDYNGVDYNGECYGRKDEAMYFNDECHARCYSSWVDSSNLGRERYPCAPNMELKMSKKVVPHNYPTNVKKLLATGILDRARVKYICFSSERELDGIIDGGGYLCGCSSCNFSKVLSAYEFEQHAGAKTRHPNNHIYLENGKPIYSIIQEIKTAPLSIIDEVIKDTAGSSINEEFFQVWKASLHRSNDMVGADTKSFGKPPCLSDSLLSFTSQASKDSFCPISVSFSCNSNFLRKQAYMGTSGERKQALKRSSSCLSSSLTKRKKTAEGGVRKRDNDLHRLLFMPNGLPDGAELAYFVKGQKILEGYKHGNGIVCSCCEEEISPSQFEAHAGMSARRQPYRHIYTSNGLTLHDIATSLANGQNITTGSSDDMCAECGDGGNLIFCQSCPRAFHAACLDLHDTPEDTWHCPNCNKFGHEGNFTRPIVIRLTRVVKTPEYDVGGCVVCRAHDFSGDTFDDRTVILCDQCEKEFHVGCLRDNGLCDLKEIPKDNWFCSQECSKIYMALQSSVSTGVQMIPASLLDIINKKHIEKGLLVDEAGHDVHWQILMGKSRKQEDLSLLSSAAAIFRDCFDPIVAKSGRDLIPVMVYGRNISGQEFGGMYCVLLTVRHVIVSAGLLRIFGKEVAELPLVATRREHQGKGYFQALFSCIERLLCSLNVERLVLPAAEEAESIWTKRFGFRKMSEGQLLKYTKELQLTIFKGTSMLEKEVPRIVE